MNLSRAGKRNCSHIVLSLPQAPTAETVYQIEYKAYSIGKGKRQYHKVREVKPKPPDMPKRTMNLRRRIKRELRPLDLAVRATPIDLHNRKSREGSKSIEQLLNKLASNTQQSKEIGIRPTTVHGIPKSDVRIQHNYEKVDLGPVHASQVNTKPEASTEMKHSQMEKSADHCNNHGQHLEVDNGQHLKAEDSTLPPQSSTRKKGYHAPFYDQTTTNVAFPKIPFTEPVMIMHRKQPKPAPSPRKAQFLAETSYNSDNPGFPSGYPAPRLACSPHAPELDLFLPSNNDQFSTEQRESFKPFGSDAYNVIHSIKLEEKYKPPVTSLASVTSYKSHFPNRGTSSAKLEYLRPPSQLKVVGQARHFYSNTTNKSHFQQWPTKPRIRLGDCHEHLFVPSKAKLDGTTMYTQEFQPLSCKPATSCKPPNEQTADEDDFLKMDLIPDE
jgi:hypothetical protein